jgi:hypothetical protein
VEFDEQLAGGFRGECREHLVGVLAVDVDNPGLVGVLAVDVDNPGLGVVRLCRVGSGGQQRHRPLLRWRPASVLYSQT